MKPVIFELGMYVNCEATGILPFNPGINTMILWLLLVYIIG